MSVSDLPSTETEFHSLSQPSSQLLQSSQLTASKFSRTFKPTRFESPRASTLRVAPQSAYTPVYPNRIPPLAPHASSYARSHENQQNGQFSTTAVQRHQTQGQLPRGPVPISPGRFCGTLTVLERYNPAPLPRSGSGLGSNPLGTDNAVTVSATSRPSPSWSGSSNKQTYADATSSQASNDGAKLGQTKGDGSVADSFDDQGRCTNPNDRIYTDGHTNPAVVSDSTLAHPPRDGLSYSQLPRTIQPGTGRASVQAARPLAKQIHTVAGVGIPDVSSRPSQSPITADFSITGPGSPAFATNLNPGSTARADEDAEQQLIEDARKVSEDVSGRAKAAIETFERLFVEGAGSDESRDLDAATANAFGAANTNLTDCNEKLNAVDQLAAECAGQAFDRLDAVQRALQSTQAIGAVIGDAFRYCVVDRYKPSRDLPGPLRTPDK